MNKTLNIAVTGLNAVDSPGSGIGVIRAIREMKDYSIRITGLSYESMEPGIYMHELIDKTYQIPYPSAGSEQLKNRLLAINEKESINVIIPNFDAELRNFIKITDDLKANGIATFLPEIEKYELINKTHLHEFGRLNKIKVPGTKFLNNATEIREIDKDFDFPVFVKGKFYEAYLAYNDDQVEYYYHKLNAKWGFPVVIQESIKGIEIDVAGLGDGKGNLIGAIPMRKLYITDKGKGWSGVVLEDERLIELAREFTRASHWRGGFELEYIRTENDELCLLEINPRFPAWIYTTVAAGQNLPEAMVRLAIGENVNPFDHYIAGKMFVRYSWDLITEISEFHQISTIGEL